MWEMVTSQLLGGKVGTHSTAKNKRQSDFISGIQTNIKIGKIIKLSVSKAVAQQR